MGIWAGAPPNRPTWFPGPIPLSIPNGISIGSSAFGSAHDRDRRTDHATPCNNRPHLRSTATANCRTLRKTFMSAVTEQKAPACPTNNTQVWRPMFNVAGPVAKNTRQRQLHISSTQTFKEITFFKFSKFCNCWTRLIVFRLHRSTTHVDEAYCYRPSSALSVVYLSVGLSQLLARQRRLNRSQYRLGRGLGWDE